MPSSIPPSDLSALTMLYVVGGVIVLAGVFLERLFGRSTIEERKAARQRLRVKLDLDEGTTFQHAPKQAPRKPQKAKSFWERPVSTWFTVPTPAPDDRVDREAFEREVRRWD